MGLDDFCGNQFWVSYWIVLLIFQFQSLNILQNISERFCALVDALLSPKARLESVKKIIYDTILENSLVLQWELELCWCYSIKGETEGAKERVMRSGVGRSKKGEGEEKWWWGCQSIKLIRKETDKNKSISILEYFTNMEHSRSGTYQVLWKDCLSLVTMYIFMGIFTSRNTLFTQ